MESMTNSLIQHCLVQQCFYCTNNFRSKFNVVLFYAPHQLTQPIRNVLNRKSAIMKSKFLLLSPLVIVSTPSFAQQCWNAKGTNVTDTINYDLSTTFNQSNNVVGQTKDLVLNFPKPVEAICEPRYAPGTINVTTRAYQTNEPIIEHSGTYKFLRINDYLLGAMRIYDSAAGSFYPPTRLYMGSHENVDQGKPFPVADSNLTFRIKVVKPFVGSVSIPSKTMFRVYVTTTLSDPLRYPVYSISYSGRIIAPQTCSIDSGKILEVKFGDILASEFSQAGIGNKPHSVNPQTKEVSVQCSNMSAAAVLTLRIEAEQVHNDMLVSNNADIGFKISDTNNNTLIPNDLNSVLPFTLDQDQHATVSFKAWPISITGQKPAVGPFNSRAYIRIDFP
ncbi:fimbrial protein [Acinetobacter bereziniae]|uniref:fimbrial protein n=1 Tax=Acinetobacter bereziniae TaxID=106648 RepID=UPI003AF8171A